jgi:hypothetical protein
MIWIPHPVGSLGSEEIRARADAVAARVEALLLGEGPDGAPG